MMLTVKIIVGALALLFCTLVLPRLITGRPVLNDVTTDTVNVPQFKSPLPYNSEFAELQKWYGETYEVTVDQTGLEKLQIYQAALDIARNDKGWTITVEEPQNFHFEATAVTPFLRFTDDIVIEVRDDRVHMRSRSRLGRDDFGANWERIHEYMRRLSAKLPGGKE